MKLPVFLLSDDVCGISPANQIRSFGTVLYVSKFISVATEKEWFDRSTQWLLQCAFMLVPAYSLSQGYLWNAAINLLFFEYLVSISSMDLIIKRISLERESLTVWEIWQGRARYANSPYLADSLLGILVLIIIKWVVRFWIYIMSLNFETVRIYSTGKEAESTVLSQIFSRLDLKTY